MQDNPARASGAASNDRRTRIVVEAVESGTPVSPDLWGIFFEDINCSADGGLYGELVQNRSFDYGPRDRPDWHSLTAWSVDPDCADRQDAAVEHRLCGRITLQQTEPLDPHSPTHAVLDASGGPLALVNAGFDGIPLEAGSAYRFSVWARALSGGPARLRIALVEEDGAVLAQACLDVVDGDWSRYESDLRPVRSCPRGRLVIGVDPPSKVAVDFVSLFAADLLDGPHRGLRRDLVQAIADLKPRFVRFPGGCVAHGLGLDNLYRWKDTIGEPTSRRQNFNIWGYHQSMGLGFHEYFLLCEELGAKPVPVVAAGVCCQNTEGGSQAVPEDEMDQYIQDVLDLVEYANGPADSEWGSIRAQAGHPEPFGLEYLAIGNEDKQDEVFRDRFERIYRAVRKHHPDLILIGTAGPSPFGSDYEEGWRFAGTLGLDVVDEHSYKAPKWLFENLDRFDAYDRGGPAVYLGEYGSKGNTMLNALAEAAYMMAIERNGDVVKLASYAPLLAKIDHTQWVPDLIYFDNQRVMPSLNYYVQQMHAVSTGDQSLRVTVVDGPEFRRPPQDHASLSVSSAGADLAITGVRLDDSDALSDLLEPGHDVARFPLSTTEGDYTVTMRVRQIAGDEGFAVAFGALDSPDFFEWHFGTWKNKFLTLFYRADGHLDEYVEPIPFSVELGRTYNLEIRVRDRGGHITCLLDGVVVHDVSSPDRPEQRFSASAVFDSTTATLHVKVVNATSDAVPVTLDLADAVELPVRGRRATLAGDPRHGAPFEKAPTTPHTSEFDPTVPVEIDPYSFTVFSLSLTDDAASARESP